MRQGKSAVTECRITQAVAERVERGSFEVTVSSALHGIILEVRKLAEVFIKGDGQTSRGIHLSTQRVGNSAAALFAGVPRFENGVCVLVRPINGQGAAIHEDDNEWFAGCG